MKRTTKTKMKEAALGRRELLQRRRMMEVGMALDAVHQNRERWMSLTMMIIMILNFQYMPPKLGNSTEMASRVAGRIQMTPTTAETKKMGQKGAGAEGSFSESRCDGPSHSGAGVAAKRITSAAVESA
jgi:hypothetical protein